jgi:hypothetical protein
MSREAFIIAIPLALIITLLAGICSCSFDYDNTYVNEPPEYVGEPCSNEGEKRRLVYGDFTLCVECLESADGLIWFEINCEDIEE